jgi:hypothetical protein
MGGEWMTGKFAATASVPALMLLTILLGARGFAQTAPAAQTPGAPPAVQQPASPTPAAQTPAAQTPAAKPPDSQEPADESSSSSSRRKRVHDYKNWVYNVGAGANLDSGPTRTWVRQGGFVAGAGVARNANKYLGLRADFIFADLPLRDSTLNLAQATGASTHAYAVTLDPIVNVPLTKEYTVYFLFGSDFMHRSGNLQSDATIPGSPCNSFWNWWGACQSSNFSLPLSGNFTDSSLNQFGYNVGVGVTRKLPSGVEFYGEGRIMHGTHNGITTDYRPITIGFRW